MNKPHSSREGGRPARTGRDGLGRFCFWLHVAVFLFIALGWTLPARPALLAYLVFLPLVVLHWRLNRGACMLNNLENWLRHRRWRVANNPEEGAWLRTLLAAATGMSLSPAAMDRLIYGAMGLFWLLGIVHFARFQGS
jgi:hypothetical protein